MAGRGWCLFWILFCTFFVVWDLTFAAIDGGWWILFFVPQGLLQLGFGVFWTSRFLDA